LVRPNSRPGRSDQRDPPGATNAIVTNATTLDKIDAEARDLKAGYELQFGVDQDPATAKLIQLVDVTAAGEALFPETRESDRQVKLSARGKKLAHTRNQLPRLESGAKSVEENLVVLKRQHDAMGRVSTDDEEFMVVQAGVGSAAPVGPDRPKLVMSGAGAGLVLAIAIMFLLHRLDDCLENPEDIEAKLEEPIFGQLPEADRRHNTEGYPLLTRMKPLTMFAEALRGVRSALLLGPDGASKPMLAVTSAVPGDGKTTCTTNFAATLAAAGNRTLLIDADLRRGNIHNYFEQPLEGGLTVVLEGRLKVDAAIHETQIQNLWLMRAGERPSNPSELLLGGRTKELIEELRGRFDYVVFDCPPLTAIDDTFSIAAQLDCLLFVVRAGRTSIRFARLAVNTIRQRGAPLVGLVVNGVPVDNPYYYYYTTCYYASYYHKPLAPTDAVYADRGRSVQTITAPAETRDAVVVAPPSADKPEEPPPSRDA
jgi:capsular exopolysaccharide synthesis family protein